MPGPFVLLTLIFALLGLVVLVLGLRALRRKRLFGGAADVTVALLFLSLSLLFATLAISTQGYRALTREEVALVVVTRQTGPQQFEARVEFPDGRSATFLLAGDELYVDARILKWKPFANILGLHTDYELDRIAGRYVALQDEQSRPRTVHALGSDKPIDLFHLRRRYPLLAPLVDAEYGSATFIASEDRGRYEVRVSTSGLLVRKVPGRS